MWSAEDGTVIGPGYSGNGPALNDPAQCDVKGHGPIPIGFYTLGEPADMPDTGKFSIPLEPDATNEMFGRDGFRWHGDNPAMDHTASDGCVVSPPDVRHSGFTMAGGIGGRVRVLA